MNSRITHLRDKELINVNNGTRYGYVGDLEVDLESGRILSLVIPGRLRLLGLLGRSKDRIFPWESVRRFGEDIILVDMPEEQAPRPGGGLTNGRK